MEESDNANIRIKFQVYGTNFFFFWIRSINKFREVATTPTHNFDSSPYPYYKVGW